MVLCSVVLVLNTIVTTLAAFCQDGHWFTCIPEFRDHAGASFVTGLSRAMLLPLSALYLADHPHITQNGSCLLSLHLFFNFHHENSPYTLFVWETQKLYVSTISSLISTVSPGLDVWRRHLLYSTPAYWITISLNILLLL